MTDQSTRWWLRRDAQSATVAATPDQIYALVADLPRMGEWSPECQRVEWLDGATGPVEGATFIGHDQGGPAGLMKWSRQRTDPHRRAGHDFSSSPTKADVSRPTGATNSRRSRAARG